MSNSVEAAWREKHLAPPKPRTLFVFEETVFVRGNTNWLVVGPVKEVGVLDPIQVTLPDGTILEGSSFSLLKSLLTIEFLQAPSEEFLEIVFSLASVEKAKSGAGKICLTTGSEDYDFETLSIEQLISQIEAGASVLSCEDAEGNVRAFRNWESVTIEPLEPSTEEGNDGFQEWEY